MYICLCLQIREELRANGIDVYPQKEFDEDAEDRLINDKIRVSWPHAAVRLRDAIADRHAATRTRKLPCKHAFGQSLTHVCLRSTGNDPVRRRRQRPGVPGERQEDPGKEDEMGHHRG